MLGQNQKLVEQAKAVLAKNDRGQYTVPSLQLYPHQWLWDSCFIAIGLAHHNPQRAAQEIKSLFRGQWTNGMLPNIIFGSSDTFWAGPKHWQSHVSKFAPAGIETSSMTQPPLVAYAAWLVAQKLPEAEREVFLKQIYPGLLAYHSWLYRERDPANSGLAVLVHPWESGLDNTPTWMKALSRTPLWISVLLKSGGVELLRRLRRDLKNILSEQKLTDIEALKLVHRLYRFRKRGYDSRLHIQKSRDTMEDLVFNSILVAANKALIRIAETIAEDLPADLRFRVSQTETALEGLWDPETAQYYSRHFKTKRLIKVSTIATFLPLFAGSIPQRRAGQLVQVLKDPSRFWPAYPVPSTALNSRYFDAKRYWRGPTWINTNWLIINGLLQYGYDQEAAALKKTCLELVASSGFREYFSPLSGEGYGIDNFSWTAALYLELTHN
ncbi:glycoside hydrolase [Candidatus Microgenomates bacterium]|nr:glycoside hydrolase [Candidatus Microgenomates bacterium]